MQLALDIETNDLILGSTGVERVTEGRYTVQAIRSELQTSKGEWRLDPRLGWVDGQDFTKQFSIFDLEMRAREIILKTKGVNSILSIDLRLEGRKLFLTFEADTIYGNIDTTVPWG